MTSMDMSLDEIIAKNRREKRTGFRKGFGRSGRSGGGSGGRFSGSRPYKTYIDFDAPPVPVRGPKIGGPSNPNKTVRINISNLAPSVVSSDLEELFVNYRIEAATVNYNESGVSVGTGDIYLRRSDAENVINDFKGVALDGQVMRMVLVDGSEALSSRVQLAPVNGGGVIKSFRNGGERRDGRGSRGGGFGRRSRSGRRARMTEAELDAELEAYMSKPRAQ
uniref:FoP_duplication domain-containing protein n=1 Tax=Haemonchus contortus TaxID=6289 RepID=A0A7I4YLA0_HAECO